MVFTLEERSRLRERVQGRDDLSIHVFELLAIVVTAWALTVHEEERPEYPGQSILMKGDNMSAVHWVNQCRGSKEPRSGALMRIMGVLEMRNGWRFRAKHIKGVANTIADGISRWDRNDIALNLHSCRPDVCWQEQRGLSFPECWPRAHRKCSCARVSKNLRGRFPVLGGVLRVDRARSVL